MAVHVIERKKIISGFVESNTHAGQYYWVEYDGNKWSCTCKSWAIHQVDCKHINEMNNYL